MNIHHLSHAAIDKEKWDQSISVAVNGLIYAQSWYLDVVAPDWEALVTDDYSIVCPIPIKRKFKLPYIVQPSLTQQLGVFSSQPISSELLQLFIQQLPSYSYELNMNAHNPFPGIDGSPNYLLDLNQSYEAISNTYSKNTIRNINKAHKLSLKVINNISIEDFISFYKQTEKEYASVDCALLERLITKGLEHQAFQLSGVANDSEEMIAALCTTEFKQRITYLVPISNEEGKKSSAMFMLVNQLVRQEAGTDKILDFEGSRIEGIARFYKGFGATNHPYYILKKLRPSFLVGRI